MKDDFNRAVLAELRLIRKAVEVRSAVSPRLLTVPQAASYLSASVWAVRSLAWSREVPSVRIGDASCSIYLTSTATSRRQKNRANTALT